MQKHKLTAWEKLGHDVSPRLIAAGDIKLSQRCVDWRFRAARLWQPEDRETIGKADEAFWRACCFARWLRQSKALAKPPLDTIHPPEPFRASWAAYGIYQEAHLRKCEIEARILANQSSAQIAKCMAIPEATAEVYEQLFFDVRDRLQAHDFISGCVIGIWDEIDPRETYRVWAFFGYHGGPVVLQALIDDLRARGEEDYRFYLQPQHDLVRTRMQRRLGLSIIQLLMPQDDRLAVLEVIRAKLRMDREDRLDRGCMWDDVNLMSLAEKAARAVMVPRSVKAAEAA